jgi:Uncharacterized protein conserved in bacteria (DUF2188)
LAKSPCRGFATRSLAGVGYVDAGFFWAMHHNDRERDLMVACSRVVRRNHTENAIMLGRHIYRVHLTRESWAVTKEGEDHPRAEFPEREEAIAEAVRQAESDEPAKVIIDNGDGTIANEWLFGADAVEDLRA